MASVNRVEIVSYYYTDYKPEARIDYTITTPGKLCGVSLIEGKIATHPEHGTVVTFDGYRNAAALKGKLPKKSGATVIVAGKPDLEALVAEARSMVAAEVVRLANEAKTLAPVGYFYESGCDSGDTNRLLWPEGSSSSSQNVAEKNWPIDLIKKHLSPAELKTIAADTGAEVIPANMSTYGGYRYGVDGLNRLFVLAREREAAIEAKRTAKKVESESRRADLIEQARSTGQRVEIRRWTEDCDGSAVECNTDVVTEYANADGTVSRNRTHTH